MMVLERTQCAKLLAAISGIGTFIFLYKIATSSNDDRKIYSSHVIDLSFYSIIALMISLALSNTLSDKIIKSNEMYRKYKTNREDLIDNMTMDNLLIVKMAFFVSFFCSWASIGMFFGCLACRIIYRG
jgi:hypothetical protein